MKRMARPFASILAAFALLACLPSLAQISVIQQPGTVHGSFSAGGQSVGATSVTLYTVPAGMYARLTDIIATTRSGATGLCYFTVGDSYEIVVPNAGTLHIPFNNGPAFAPGATIAMSRSNRIEAQCSDYIFFTVRGYLFTVP